MEYVRNFANYFKVSLDYLLGVDNSYNHSYIQESDTKYEIKVLAAHAIDDLTEEEQLEIIKYAKYIKSQRDETNKK